MRSVHSRMDTINAEVRRLNGCLKQVENLNPSGALEKDIVSIIYVLFFFFNTLLLGGAIFNVMFTLICS